MGLFSYERGTPVRIRERSILGANTNTPSAHTGVLRLQETTSSYDSTLGLCLGPMVALGGWRFLMDEVLLLQILFVGC